MSRWVVTIACALSRVLSYRCDALRLYNHLGGAVLMGCS